LRWRDGGERAVGGATRGEKRTVRGSRRHGGGKPRRSLGCDQELRGSSHLRRRLYNCLRADRSSGSRFAQTQDRRFGKPRLNATFDVCASCTDHEPRCRGSPRCVANVVLLVPAAVQIGDKAPLRGGLPAPNGEAPRSARSQPRERGGLPAPSWWSATSRSPFCGSSTARSPPRRDPRSARIPPRGG
jgi:hypothetical protein